MITSWTFTASETYISANRLNKYYVSLRVYPMLKFIIISILFIYVVYKASDFILRMLDSVTGRNRMKSSSRRERNFGPEHRRQQRSNYRQPKNGNVNIDYIPEDEKNKKQRHPTEDFRGGDYVDYEELK